MIIITVVDKTTNNLFTKASENTDEIFSFKPVGDLSITDVLGTVKKIEPIVGDKEFIIKFFSDDIIGSIYTTDVVVFGDMLSIFNNR